MTIVKKTNKGRIASLFSINSFKRDYSNFINDLLRKLYQGENWGKLLGDGNYGIINTNYSLEKLKLSKSVREYYVKVHENKDPLWSLLNYVNTHWSSFAEITDTLNHFIIKGYIKNEKTLLDFHNDYFENLDKMKYLLTKYGKYIFFPNDNLTIFYRIMSEIATSTYIGNMGECMTMKHISNLGNITNVIKSEPGQKIDTHHGVDIKFNLNGIPKTLQCKSFINHYIVNDQYIFRNISNPGWYNVDYFSFVNNKYGDIYIFDAMKNGLKYKENRGTYIFDEELLKFKIENNKI